LMHKLSFLNYASLIKLVVGIIIVYMF